MGDIRSALRILVGKPEGQRDHLECLCVHGRIILKLILKKWYGHVWTGLIWLRIGTGSWGLRTR